jgi:hypothetical protein
MIVRVTRAFGTPTMVESIHQALLPVRGMAALMEEQVVAWVMKVAAVAQVVTSN